MVTLFLFQFQVVQEEPRGKITMTDDIRHFLLGTEAGGTDGSIVLSAVDLRHV